jgi:hypothetical protein
MMFLLHFFGLYKAIIRKAVYNGVLSKMSMCRVKIQYVNNIGHKDTIRDLYCRRPGVRRHRLRDSATK